MIKVVLIDIDNTLLDFNEGSKDAMLLAADEFGIKFPENYYDVFTEINNSLWEKIEKGELTRQGLFKIRWNTIFEKMGISADGPVFEEVFRKNIKLSAIPVKGANEILKYLSEKYFVCVASNSSFEQQRARLEKAAMLPFIKKVFTSEEIGFSKPSTEFFEACMRELPDVKKEEIIIIGDSINADIEGGHSFGFKTCWFNYGKTPHENCTSADFIVDSLEEIKNIL